MNLTRILDEGYGPGAWHGADMKAATADVRPALAFHRPAPGRHNIAEITLHHAFYVHSVRGRLLGAPIEPFPIAGEDWFAATDDQSRSWLSIGASLGDLQGKLSAVVKAIDAGETKSALSPDEQLAVVLGLSCHAAYHAGQIQLIKALAAG
jgi:hypothetical protein